MKLVSNLIAMHRGSFNFLANFIFTVFIFNPICLSDKNINRPIEVKIDGGNYTTINQFPHAVFLFMSCGLKKMICGSNILTQQILVTAAHCLLCKNKFRIDAYAGHENYQRALVVRPVTAAIIHKDYDDFTKENDIALLLVSESLPLCNNIKRVILRDHIPVPIRSAFVAGWGITDDLTRQRTTRLKMVRVPIYSREECVELVWVYNGMMCGGSMEDIHNRPASGDSGSGLVTEDKQLIGLVSFRYDEHPGLIVYTDIQYYYEWIKEYSKALYCSNHNL